MPHITLEEHLEEYCPKCGLKHGAKWKAQFEGQILYVTTKCVECSYLIFKKRDFHSCGSIAEML